MFIIYFKIIESIADGKYLKIAVPVLFLFLSHTHTQNPSSSSQIFQKSMTRGKCMTYRGEFQMRGTLEISKELESAVNTCQALQ